MSPVSELAIMVQILCNPENVPIAVATSFLWVMFVIYAFETPSVAAAYTP
jgi:hypothetical protein